MKSSKLPMLIPPMLALAIMGTWIFRQRTEISNLQQAGTPESSSGRHSERPAATDTPRVVDPMKSGWKPFALQMQRLLATSAVDPASKKAFLEYRNRIKQMSVGEIIAAVGQIDKASFADDDAKSQLLGIFQLELLEREPRTLLEIARNGIKNGGLQQSHSLKEALWKVAASSPQEAINWMNEVVEKGAFDYAGAERNNPTWLEYEATLVFGLLADHPALAEERFAGLPPEARGKVLFSADSLLFTHSGPRLESAYVRFCRKFQDPDEVRLVVAGLADRAAVIGGTAAVSNMLTNIEATPAERAAMSIRTISDQMAYISRGKVPDLDDVETIRNWVATQPGADPERATGAALGYLAGSPKFGLDKAFESILRYHERSHSDYLLAEFLRRSVVWQDPARCKELAALIVNENLRKESMSPPK